MNFFQIALVLGALVSTANGNWTKIDENEYQVGKPPVTGSAQHQQELKLLHDHESTRTKTDCSLAAKQTFPTFDAFFGPEMGLLTKQEARKVKPFISRVMRYTEKITTKFKNIYLRPRPYRSDPTLKPCAVKPTGSKSYPSSHASAATAGACILAELFPAQTQALTAHGTRLGELRVISGVHHPSDVASGQDLAEQICERLLKEKDFREELDDVRAEL